MAIRPHNEVRLRTLRLPLAQVDQAFGIVLITGPSMSLNMWRSYAQARLEAAPSTAGIMSVQCDRAFIHGLFGYEIGPVGVDRCMTIDLFIACDQIGDRIARIMITAAEDIAADQACSAIHLGSHEFRAAKIIVLEPKSLAAMSEHGYVIESMQLSKTLNPRSARICSPCWPQRPENPRGRDEPS